MSTSVAIKMRCFSMRRRLLSRVTFSCEYNRDKNVILTQQVLKYSRRQSQPRPCVNTNLQRNY
jgi:hypothetical protein